MRKPFYHTMYMKYFTIMFLSVLCILQASTTVDHSAYSTSVVIPAYKLVIDGNEFEIFWSMDTGEVSSITVDKQSKSIIVTLERSEPKEDSLLVTLPRKLIDAGKDEAEFIITVDHREVHFEETQASEEVRGLAIPLSPDATKVQIIGTYIIPEFPISLLIVSVTIGLTVIMLRLRTVRLHSLP